MARYVTTDLHGCLQTFQYLLENKLRLTRADEFYLLGDYVNKGPDSKGVLDHIMALQADGYAVHCLRGNHDQELLDAAQGRPALAWLREDERALLASFNVRSATEIPAPYVAWLAALPYEFELPDFVLVHAGYDFAQPVEKMRHDYHTMMNIKQFVFDPSRLQGKRLVHGHVPTPTADVKAAVAKRQGAICLDTGCVYRHNPELRHLTALNLDTWELTLVENQEPGYPIAKR